MKTFKRLFTLSMLLLGICSGAWAVSDALNGVFSVSSTKKVAFSKGNLQQVNGTWQFAEKQYDYFGSDQSDSHKDLFTFGNYSFPEGDVDWHIMSKAEWLYLYNERSVTNTLSEDARYIKATLGGTYRGVIVFPDTYIQKKQILRALFSMMLMETTI